MTSTVRRGVPVLIGALLVATVAATFAPWVRSGESRRDSYEVARTAATLDVVDGAAATAARRAWPFVPLVSCLAGLAFVLDRDRLGTVLATVVGVLVVGFAIAVSNAPRHVAWGATAGLVLGAALLAVAVLSVSIRPQPSVPPTLRSEP